ncbi:hypothetical protein LCGC14_2154320 [marine sediment metagenome]|uniref:Uncharacterized protein n=1 Tax=marine sediment metagenome TaxID=412755 RepID=A0A0F9GQZ2_9ZZZZ
MALAEFASRSNGEIFISDEITGTGSEADTAHGLADSEGTAVTPSLVVAFITQKTTGTSIALVEGTHDATNCKFSLEAQGKYRIIAFR